MATLKVTTPGDPNAVSYELSPQVIQQVLQYKPLRSINNVEADADGNVTIEVEGISEAELNSAIANLEEEFNAELNMNETNLGSYFNSLINF